MNNTQIIIADQVPEDELH